MKQVVCFYSFYGLFSDNPRAMYEEMVRRGLDYEYVWLVKPGIQISGPARAVELHSDESRRITQTADYIVANTYIDDHGINPDAIFVQTWHGTPLKRIALDNPNSLPRFREEILPRYVAQWDYLVTQNAFSSEKLVNAFAFEGQVLQTGYPRNDVLSSSSAPQIRANARQHLGIPDHKTAVLYEPTWREHPNGEKDTSLHLDLAKLRECLADDFVVLLRLHYYVAAEFEDVYEGFVHDVSSYEDISVLYLASDVLLTDYSSSMFDFAVTGRPIALFTYDLDSYKDEVRGFYFDLESRAPGPILRTNDDVVKTLLNIGDMHKQYASRYESFKKDFCSLEDGSASGRLIDAVFRSAS